MSQPQRPRARAPRVKTVPLRVAGPGLVPVDGLDAMTVRSSASATGRTASAAGRAGAAPVDPAPPRKRASKKQPTTAAPAPAPAKSAPTKAAATKAAATKAAATKAATTKAAAARPAVAQPAAGATSAGGQAGDVWDQRVAGALSFLRRRLTGRYEVDEFGFDPDLAEAMLYPVLRLLYEQYFRVECFGAENLPDGPALLVANHSGTLPMDALMLANAVHEQTQGRRHLRLLGADLVFRMPFVSEVARKMGSTLACNPDATRLLHNGEYVGVFPEGFKGLGKPYKDRYRLQRFGRGGFVAAAVRTQTPIVPVSIVGAEEIYPIIADLRPVARVAGLPYFPVTPLFPWLGPLGLLPLPSKWLIQFGTPIETASYHEDPDDPIVVFNLADQVRESIQHTLHTLLERRPDPFS